MMVRLCRRKVSPGQGVAPMEWNGAQQPSHKVRKTAFCQQADIPINRIKMSILHTSQKVQYIVCFANQHDVKLKWFPVVV